MHHSSIVQRLWFPGSGGIAADVTAGGSSLARLRSWKRV